MYKFIFFTDSQADDRTLSFRLDDFGETILNKLDFVVKAANEIGADVFCGGDFIDRPYITYPYLNRIISSLKKLERKFYIVLGNHDIVGRNLESYHKTAIGVLEKAGVLKVFEKPLAIEGFYIKPIPYTELHVPALYESSDPTIFITHNMVVPKDLPFEHLLPSSISPNIHNPRSLVLSGHSHVPFCLKSDGITFLNPGSLGRVSREPGEFDRIPAIALFEINDGDFEFKITSIPFAKKAEEIFIFKPGLEDRPSIDLTNLRKLIHSTKSQSFSIIEYVKLVGSENKINNSVLTESLKRISDAEESFQGMTGQ